MWFNLPDGVRVLVSFLSPAKICGSDLLDYVLGETLKKQITVSHLVSRDAAALLTKTVLLAPKFAGVLKFVFRSDSVCSQISPSKDHRSQHFKLTQDPIIRYFSSGVIVRSLMPCSLESRKGRRSAAGTILVDLQQRVPIILRLLTNRKARPDIG
jgi:hypothetical protein